MADEPRPPTSMLMGPEAVMWVGLERPLAGGSMPRPYSSSTAIAMVVTRTVRSAGPERLRLHTSGILESDA